MAERFPLAYGANFQCGAVGGEKEHKLSIGGSTTHTQAENEVAAHGHEWVGWAGSGSSGGTYTGLGGFKGDVWDTVSGSWPTYDGGTGIKRTSAAKPMDIMNPYIGQNIIVRAL